MLPAKLNQFEYLVKEKNIADFDLFLLVCQLSLLLWSGLLDNSLAAMLSYFSAEALQYFKNIRKFWVRYKDPHHGLIQKGCKNSERVCFTNMNISCRIRSCQLGEEEEGNKGKPEKSKC